MEPCTRIQRLHKVGSFYCRRWEVCSFELSDEIKKFECEVSIVLCEMRSLCCLVAVLFSYCNNTGVYRTVSKLM